MKDSKNVKRLLYNAIVTRSDAYAVQQTDGNYLKIDSPLTIDKLLNAPNMTIGVYMLNQRSHVKCAVIDIDTQKDAFQDSGNDISQFWEILKKQSRQITSVLKRHDINYHIEFSGRRGLHI